MSKRSLHIVEILVALTVLALGATLLFGYPAHGAEKSPAPLLVTGVARTHRAA